jgi:two-component system chemotaxis response regulator CheY
MAILIADDEDNTREVLKEFLVRMGHKNILEAPNGVEAAKMAEQEKGRIKMIIADWEMPQMDGLSLVKKIAQIPELDGAPFLLITSDLPDSTIEEFYKENPRLDGYLNKPFQRGALEKALSDAYKKRCKLRSTIILLSDEEPPATLVAALQENKAHHWRQIIRVDSVESLEKTVETNSRQLGAIFIDPTTYKNFKNDWFETFKKTPQGAKTITVCLSSEPTEALPLRTHSNFFLEPTKVRKVWDEFLSAISQRMLSTWEIENLMNETKSLIQQKNQKQALKLIDRMVAADPHNAEILCMKGGIQSDKDAIKSFQESLKVNPFLPHAYVKLLGLLKKNQTERLNVADLSTRFCPKSVDVLLVAAQTYFDCGQHEKTLAVIKYILELDSKNESALKLQSSLLAIKKPG